MTHNYFSEALNDTLPVALSVLAGDIATSSVSGVTLFSEKTEIIIKQLSPNNCASYFITSVCMCRWGSASKVKKF